MEGTWILLITGGLIALCFEILSINALAISVGLYLPFELSSTIFLGGIVFGIKLLFFQVRVFVISFEKG